MKPQTGRLRPVEVECFYCLLDVGSQFVPSVALGEDAFRQAFGTEATVGFLRHLEDDFIHTFNLGHLIALSKRSPTSNAAKSLTLRA